MTDALWEDWFGGRQKERAARLDGEAVSNPTKHSANEVAMAELLADVLGHQPAEPGMHARWLLGKCQGDYDGLRKLITALRIDGELEWVRLKRKNAYGLRHWLAEEYAEAQQAEEQWSEAHTTAGRRAKYVTEGVLS